MGCDIHGWVEVNRGGKWVAFVEFTNKARERNYARFAALAGVRGEGPEALGFPEDAADTTRLHFESWQGDAHSASFLPMAAAWMLWRGTDPEQLPVEEHKFRTRQDHPLWYYFGIDEDWLAAAGIAKPQDMRVVFWFDN